MTLLNSWQDEFERIDHSPWPGPRPIVNPDKNQRQLAARKVHAEEFTSAVLDHSLVVLTGDSGVGKTSLLGMKLIPSLEKEGFVPLLCRDWKTSSQPDPALLVARTVAKDLGRAEPGAADEFWAGLDLQLGSRAVLVLDQFEELIRYHPGLFREALHWIGRLNRASQMRVVISLRAEYLHRLRVLESTARPFTMTTYFLKPLSSDDEIGKVIDSGNAAADQIDAPARIAIIDVWREAQKSDAPPGLLHLQAVLFTLAHQPERDSAPEIRTADVASLVSRALEGSPSSGPTAAASPRTCNRDDSGNGSGSMAWFDRDEELNPAECSTVFEFGLRESVKLKLDHCKTASRLVGLDRVLVDGTDALVGRIVPHLSSGGFKLVREEWELAQRALERELAKLRVTGVNIAEDSQSLNAARTMYLAISDLRHGGVDLLEEMYPKGEIGEPAEPVLDLGQRSEMPYLRSSDAIAPTDRVQLDWAPWKTDPHDVSSGPMLGMPERAVLYQELRRFAFAMCWLNTASLIRSSTPSEGRTMVALIHDGFGPALETAYGGARDTPAHTLARITAAQGEELIWPAGALDLLRTGASDQPPADEQADDAVAPEPITITNARWRDCTLTADLHQVIFVNCDFRGTRFDGCTFRGVTFVNCLLDNTAFVHCTVAGATHFPRIDTEAQLKKKVTDSGDRFLPDFRIETTAAEVRLVETYRGLDPSGAGSWYSRTSGLAAVPLQDNDKDSCSHPEGIRWTHQEGGLTMYGGRLSSLMVRGCQFEDGGTIAFRHIAGSALDIVEQRGGRFEILDSAIRGLTVTAPVENRDVASNAPELISVDVAASYFANTWFGDGLAGSLEFRDCVVRQVLSLGDPGRFSVQFDDKSLLSGQGNELGVHGSPTREDWTGRDAQNLTALIRMDYRSRPAQLEIEARLRVLGSDGA